MLKNLWNDEVGALVSAELTLVSTIVVLGSITGLTTLRDAIVTEMADVAAAISDTLPTTDPVGEIDGSDGGVQSLALALAAAGSPSYAAAPAASGGLAGRCIVTCTALPIPSPSRDLTAPPTLASSPVEQLAAASNRQPY